jgi:hypothetical protein
MSNTTPNPETRIALFQPKGGYQVYVPFPIPAGTFPASVTIYIGESIRY